MNIETIAVDLLIPYARNSRTHSDEQVAQIAASIREFGFTNPVLIDGQDGIIAGHGRVLGARKLGMSDVPCIRLAHLSEAQKRAYVIADNKLALNAGWDEKMLALELQDLQGMDFDLSLTGFLGNEIDELLAELDATPEGETDADETPEVQAEVITQHGDVWVLGKHRVMCGDSTDAAAVNVLMDGKKADMVFTDPPYGVSIVNTNQAEKVGGGGVVKFGKVGGGGVVKFGKVGGGGVVDAKNYMEIIGDDTTETARKFYQSCVEYGFENFILWGGNYFTDFLSPSPCWIVWDKQNSGNFADVELAWCSSSKSAKLYTFTWNGMSRSGNRKDELSTRVHPTQKPVGLFEAIFNDFVFDSCFDGFLGSGSTLIACEKTGRRCFGMELSPEYCDVIVRRWQQYTGKTATHAETGKTFDETAAVNTEE